MTPVFVITAVFVALALIILLVCVLKSMSRTVFKSGVSLLVILLSLALSMLLARMVGAEVVKFIIQSGMIEFPAELFTELPSSEELILGLSSIIVAPLLFAPIFLVLRLFFSILGAIVVSIVSGNMAGKPFVTFKSKPIGAAIGLVCGVLLCVIYFTPIAGYTGLVSSVGEKGFLTEGSDMLQEGLTEEEYAQLDEILQMPVFSITRTLGGNVLFDEISTTKMMGTKVCLTKEMVSFCDIFVSINPLISKDIADWGENEVSAIEDGIPNALENSALLRILVAEVLSGASNAWLEGDTFLGTEKPPMGELFEPAIDSILKSFQNSTPETVEADIAGMIPILSASLKLSSLEGNVTEEDFFNMIGDLVESPEAKKILVTTGVSMLGSGLGLYQNKDIIYVEYMERLAGISEMDLSVEEMQNQIEILNEYYVIQMSETEVATLAHSLKANPYIESVAMLSTWSVDDTLEEWIHEIATEVTNTEEALAWLLNKAEIPTQLVTVSDLMVFLDESELLDSLGKEELIAILNELEEMANTWKVISIDNFVEMFGETIKVFTATEAGINMLTNLVTGILQSDTVCNMFQITPTQATLIAEKMQESDLIRNLNSETNMVLEIQQFIKELEATGAFSNFTF